MANSRPRIVNTDSFESVIEKLAEGYPGADEVLTMIREYGDGLVEFGDHTAKRLVFQQLDHLALYGDNIWKLYREVCSENFTCFMAVLRAERIGLLSWDTVKAAIEEGRALDVNAVLQQVQERLSNFGEGLPR
jgi:hypothetical protein